MNSSAETRTEIRALRRSLPAGLAQRNSAAIAHRLASSRIFEQSSNIAAYLGNDGEVGTEPLIQAIWAHGKDSYLPILRFAPEKRL